MLNFCDFIQVFVFTTNHQLNVDVYYSGTPVLIVMVRIIKITSVLLCNRSILCDTNSRGQCFPQILSA